VAASLSAPTLFELAYDLGKMQIHANVSEADIGVVKEGRGVPFRVDAHRNRDFTGVVIDGTFTGDRAPDRFFLYRLEQSCQCTGSTRVKR